MDSKLIIIEGIPGSGKSSTAQFVSEWLGERGIHAYLHKEGSTNHPVALDGLAFLESDQYRALLKHQVNHQELLQHSVTEISGGFLLNFRGMQAAAGAGTPSELLEELESYEAYSTLSASRIMRLYLDRWRNFVQQATAGEGVYVFECCFLQDPLTVLFGQHNCQYDPVQEHLLRTADIIHELDPMLIYLNVDSVRTTLKKAVESRPRAWIDFVAEYITGQGMGQARGWSGFEGVIQFYEQLYSQQMEIIPHLGLQSLIVNVSRRDWDNIHTRISTYLAGSFSDK
jgi:hypothetical protein